MRAFLRLSYVTLYMTRKTSFAPCSRSVLIQGVSYPLSHRRAACCSFTLRSPHYSASDGHEGYSLQVGNFGMTFPWSVASIRAKVVVTMELSISLGVSADTSCKFVHLVPSNSGQKI